VRYLLIFVLVLAGCTATQWTKQGATTVDLDRDYDECRTLTKADPAIAALYGAFGAAGVFLGTNANDSRIRACLQARGWAAPGTSNDAKAPVTTGTAPTSVTAGTAAIPVTEGTAAVASPTPQLLKTAEPAEAESPAAKRLKELKSLLDQRLITNSEYEERRQAILRGL
jgi:hypothetical protein